jgi:hypothetical protein
MKCKKQRRFGTHDRNPTWQRGTKNPLSLLLLFRNQYSAPENNFRWLVQLKTLAKIPMNRKTLSPLNTTIVTDDRGTRGMKFWNKETAECVTENGREV